MGVYKRGGMYWFEFCRADKRYRRPTGVKNKRVAEDIESAFRLALAKNDVGIVERKAIPNFKTAMSGFLNLSQREHKAKPATYVRYRTSSVALLKYFGDESLDKITPEEAERYKADRLSQFKTVRAKGGKRKPTHKNIQPSTINRELACLRAMYNHVMKGTSF